MLDERMRELAERQHALLTRVQARDDLGATWREIESRVNGPDWVEETPRVIRLVGAPRTDHQRIKVMELDTGPDSVISLATAGWLWVLPGFRLGLLEATRLRAIDGRPQSLGVLHRPRLLLPHHITEVRGIRVTSLPRTLFDLAGRLHPDRTPIIVDRVLGKSPGVLPVLHQLLDELGERGRPGITVMRKVLKKRPIGYKAPQSGLEIRFEAILEQAGEKPFDRQVDAGGHDWIGRVDYVDWDYPFVVEIDSAAYHSSVTDRALDKVRDEKLVAAGFLDVVRIPSEDVWSHPDRVVAAIRQVRSRLRRAA
jgi:very-short-patch-repair endonuclease